MGIAEDYAKFKEEHQQGRVYDVKSVLSVADAMQYQEEQTAADKAYNVGKSFYNGFVAQTAGGVLRGFQWLRDVNEAQLNAAHPERQQMDEGMRQLLDDAANAEIFKPYEVQANSGAERFAYDLVQGAGQLAGQVAISAATGGYGNLPAMALQIGGEEYKELREQGVDVETAGTAAAINAAVQTPLEYLGFSKITKAFPANTMMKQRVRLLLEDAITEGVTEFAQEYPEQISKLWALNADKSPEEIMQIVKDNINNMSADALYSGTIGAILGGGAGGLHMALDRNIQRVMAREAHSVRMEEEENRVNRIKESGENPARAAVIINDNMQNETVYVDGETLQGYAQEKGIEKVAESLGVTVEDIEKAAADGDTVDVKIGNFEATGAAFDGFMDAVKDDTAFEDGGYTPNQDKLEQEWAKKYQAQEQAINAEEDRLFNEMREAGVNKQMATEGLALLRARAVMMDDPAEFLNKLSFQAGGDAGNGYQQFAGENAKGVNEAALQKALGMVWSGKTPEEIYKETGWFRGDDGKWRFEIPDDVNKIDFAKVKTKRGVSSLEKVYDNPALFEAYPFLKKVRVVATEYEDDAYHGMAYGKTIEISKKDLAENENEAFYTLIHEIQHLIQDREGFARGGTAEEAREILGDRLKNDSRLSKLTDDEIYEALAGEQEARYTENRADLRLQLDQALEDKADAEEKLAEAIKNKDEKAEDEARKALFVATMQERKARQQLEALPTPHGENAIVIFGDSAVGKVSASTPQQSLEAFLQVNSGDEETKGAYNPNTNIITLFNGADASTVIHETWHFFVEQMWNSVQDGTASAQTIKDFDTLLGYAGMTRDEWANADVNGRRAAHERLAEAGETYIMEGKSPSFELRRVFQKFAEWLKSVYRTLQRSENAAELTDEVREVFDRMLAAEDDIAHMERVNGYFAKLPDVITDNMSEATKMRVENFIDKARDKAVEMLTRRALKNYTKERREEVKKFKEEIRPSVEEEVSKRRVYACGVTQKDVNKYRDIQKQKQEFYKISGGIPFAFRHSAEAAYLMEMDLRAEQYGYSSADEMMKDIEASPTKEQAVKQRINERVEELSGENEKENYASAIREALYNEDEALLIGVEQQLIEDYAAKAKERQEAQDQKTAERKEQSKISAEIAAARKQQAKNAARADLAKMTVKEATRTNKFITAERRAAAKCAELLAKKKFDEALAQKNLQAYWHAMAAESIKIAKRQKQYEKFLKTQVKLKPEAWLNEANFAAVSQLFTRMGIARPVHLEAAGNTEYPSLAAYADAMKQLYDCVDIAPWILDESIPLSDTNALTLEQYEDVVNAVKNIKAIVKAQKGVDTFNRQETWANTKALMMEKLSALKTIWTPNPNKPTKATAMERFVASMENLDTFLEFMDNATYGFFSKTFGNAIKHASDKEYEYREQYDKADAEALKKWLPDAAAESASNEEVYYDELGNSVTKHTLVKMLINLGNKENAQRLCETVPVGFEKSTIWIMPDEITDRQTAAEATRQNLVSFLGRVLTKEDVEYAQRKINAAEMFWGEKNELEKRVKGFGLKKVEATPVELMINGEAVVLRGGYFPLMRNGETGSHAATAEVQDDDPLQGKRIRTYHTSISATMARTNARYPVNLFPGAETQWIYESIHDLCWRETMSDFRRVLNDQELFATMKSKIGAARMQVFKEMLEVCADPQSNSKSVSEFEKLLGDQINWLRQRTSHAVIMLNLKVIAQNYANALLYGNAIEGYTMADNLKALGTYMLKYHLPGSHGEMVDFVFSKSSFLRERCELPDITVRDIVNENKEFAWEKAAREIGIKAMAMTDNATAIPNWLTAYNKKLSEGALEQEAIDYADTLVRRVLGSSRITDVASMQRGGALAKALTMFQSFFNARLGEFLRMERLASKQWTNGQKMEAFANVASYVVYKWLGQTMLAMALALQNPLGVDDDDKWPELVKELKSYSFSMMGPVGQLGNALVGSVFGMHEYTYRMSAIESTIENVNRSIKRIHSDKATTQDKLEGIANTVTLFAGVPAQLNRIFWNTVDIVLNGMKPEVGDIMRRRPKKERK